MNYKFIFGNAPELAQEELNSVGTDLTPQESIKRLGGTVKIVEILPENVNLTEIVTGDFGISDLTGKIDVHRLCQKIKDETGKRFVLPRDEKKQLSSVVVTKKKLIEIIIGDGWFGRTVVVQDFEDWGRRDYGRPAVEGHIGMLPPKVARMMVNIAIGERQSSASKILDPFCGVGTIAAEALMVGSSVLASDLDQRQVDRTKKNLEWLAREYKIESVKYKVFQGDARRASQSIHEKVDAIVTEPDLGPNSGRADARRIGNGQRLEDLYASCLREWTKVLKPSGRVVIVLPSTGTDDQIVKNVVDKAKSMGYILQSHPLPYFRPQARIKRNICIFTRAGE